MAIIKAKHGSKIIVDENLFTILNQFSWHIKNGYAVTTIKGKFVTMHRLIMGQLLLKNTKYVVDHINSNKTDNRVKNLQLILIGANSQKSVRKTNKESSFIGIKKRSNGYYSVTLRKFSKTFPTAIEAARYYDAKVVEIYGKTALTNKQVFSDIVKKLSKKP